MLGSAAGTVILDQLQPIVSDFDAWTNRYRAYCAPIHDVLRFCPDFAERVEQDDLSTRALVPDWQKILLTN